MTRQVRRQPGKIRAGALAVAVHALFFVLLVVGVSWQNRPAVPVSVDLWSSLPTPEVAPKPAPLPQPEPAKPEPQSLPKPEPKPEPLPKPEPKPEPAPDKADILRKEREEKLKLQQEEQKRKQEEQKKKAEEQKRIEDQKRKDELAKKKQEQLAKLAAEKAAKAAADSKADDYLSKIQALIRSNTIIPPDITGNPEVVYRVTLLPTGDILDIQLVKSSGFPSYDAATERAIRKSAPLPVPKDDPLLFQSRFRQANYAFRPNS